MFETLISKFALMALRNGATFAGAWLVAQGYLKTGDSDAFLGSVLFLGSLAISTINTIVAHKKLQDARQ